MNCYPQNDNGDYWRRLYAQTQAEAMRGANRMQQSIHEHTAKAEISAQKEEQIARVREDVRREAECLADTVSIGPDGEVFFERKFFRRHPEQFELLNVRMREVALLEPREATDNATSRVLMLVFQRRIGNEEMERLFIAEFGNLRMVNKRLRGTGIVFRCPGRKRDELLSEFIRACCELASVYKVPMERGFYWESETLRYANGDATIWEEVLMRC